MSYDVDLANKGLAAATLDKARAYLRILRDRATTRYAPWEEELITRLGVLAALGDELHIAAIVDPVLAVAVWGQEAGGYRLARRLNGNGSNDLGPLQENSVHGRADALRLSRIDVMAYWRDVLAPRRVKSGQHPLQDYNAFTSGDYAAKVPYAAEAWRRVTTPHPTRWP